MRVYPHKWWFYETVCLAVALFRNLYIWFFLFSDYCPFVGLRVISIVSGGCHQSFSAFFYVIFKSMYRCVNAVFNAGKSSSPSFLDTYSLSTSSLGCYALCMVISFLVLRSICLFSLVLIKKGPEYLTSGTAQVFILLIRFLLDSFVSSSFLVLLRNSFWIFPFISTCLMVSTSKMPNYL